MEGASKMYRNFYGYDRDCGGRHARRHGFGGLFGGVVGGRGFGWHGFRAGRKLGADDLQLVILALLADKPYHGYEIIKALEGALGRVLQPEPRHDLSGTHLPRGDRLRIGGSRGREETLSHYRRRTRASHRESPRRRRDLRPAGMDRRQDGARATRLRGRRRALRRGRRQAPR